MPIPTRSGAEGARGSRGCGIDATVESFSRTAGMLFVAAPSGGGGLACGTAGLACGTAGLASSHAPCTNMVIRPYYIYNMVIRPYYPGFLLPNHLCIHLAVDLIDRSMHRCPF